MKKFVSLLTVFVFAAHIGLLAETAEQPPLADTVEISNPAVPATPVADQIITSVPSAATGTAAARSSQGGRNVSWQNYVFAGTAVVLATIGIIVVTMSKGQSSPSTN
jgi:hypothetical protein